MLDQPLQPSRYLVSAKFRDRDGMQKRIVFQTRTGGLVLIAEDDWRKITSGLLHDLSPATLELALAREIVVPQQLDELALVLNSNRSDCRSTSTLYQVIMPTAWCQLACNESDCGAYCGQTHEKRKLASTFDQPLLDHIKGKMARGGFTHLQIGWFGGEPLLALDVIRRLTPKIRALADAHGCSFSSKIVTNGLALTASVALELHEQHGINRVEITLDGTAEYHDRRRATKTGRLPTFDAILSNLVTVAALPELGNLQIVVRSNVDRRNRAGILPLIDLLAANRLQKRISFYLAPLHPWGNEVSEVSISRDEFAALELDVAAALISKGFSVPLIPRRRSITCLAVNESADVIDPYGAIHHCTETPLVATYAKPAKPSLAILSNTPTSSPGISSGTTNKYAVTDLASYGEARPSPLRGFFNEVEAGRYPCHSCEMLPVCGGGCPLSWREGNLPCPSAKDNIEGRLLLWYAAHQRHKAPAVSSAEMRA